MSEEKSCFIIMPITTPEALLDTYADGVEHFQHVLECLFIPALNQASYHPILPIAKGADLIHAEIIKNLETADLVLCDMSCLNQNVFLELGIRIALNKPVCMIKDEHTTRIPFDVGVMNYHEYSSVLAACEIETQVAKLSKHIQNSAERSDGQNTLWKYLGFKAEASQHRATGKTDKLGLIALQLDVLQSKVDSITADSDANTSLIPQARPPVGRQIAEDIKARVPNDVSLHDIKSDEEYIVEYSGQWDSRDRIRTLRYLENKYSRKINLRYRKDRKQVSKE